MECTFAVENTDEIARSVSITIPRTLFKERFEAALGKTARRVQLKGFRPGHAPRTVVGKLYGEEIRAEVIGELVSNAYEKAIEAHNLDVVSRPELSFDYGDNEEADIKVSAAVNVAPQPVISGYRDLDLVVSVEEFREDAVEKEIAELRRNWAKYEPITDRTVAEKGDKVCLNVSPWSEQAGEDESNQPTPQIVDCVIGWGTAPEWLESAVIGQAIGERREVEEQRQKKKTEEVAESQELETAKKSKYLVELLSIEGVELPELSDEFLLEHKVAKNLEELRTTIAEEIRKRITRTNEERRQNAVLEAIIGKNDFRLPQELVDQEIVQMLYSMGYIREKDLQKFYADKANIEPFRAAFQAGCERNVKRRIALSQIIKQEGISVTDEDLEEYLRQEFKGEEGENSAAVLLKKMTDARREQLRDTVRAEKALKRLIEAAKITEQLIGK